MITDTTLCKPFALANAFLSAPPPADPGARLIPPAPAFPNEAMAVSVPNFNPDVAWGHHP